MDSDESYAQPDAPDDFSGPQKKPVSPAQQAANRRWKARNRAKRSAQAARWRANNRSRLKIYKHQWYLFQKLAKPSSEHPDI